jgi:hypothetical protein
MSGDITIDNAGATTIGTGVVTNADINTAAAIAVSKLAAGTSAQFLVNNATPAPAWVSMSGDATITNAGALTIANNAVTNAKVSTSAAIAVSKLAAGTTGQVLMNNNTPTPTWTTFSGDVTVGTTGTTAIATGVIVNADLSASAAVAVTKLASGSAGQVLLNNSTPTPTWTSLTGDVTIDNTGVTTIATGIIVDADISASAAISSTKMTTWENDQVVLSGQVFG